MVKYTWVLFSENEQVLKMYKGKTKITGENSGLDLYFPKDTAVFSTHVQLINLEIVLKLRNNETGAYCPFLVLPRSSIYKSNFRLANNVGLIDRAYYGELKAAFDMCASYNNNNLSRFVTGGTSLLQAVCPELSTDFTVEYRGSDAPFVIDTLRGTGGFGSTNAE